MRATLSIDAELWRKAKRRAAEQGTSFSGLVADALRRILAPAVRPAGVRYKLKLDVVRGRRPPAVDIADRDRLYDFLDGRP